MEILVYDRANNKVIKEEIRKSLPEMPEERKER